MMLFLAAWVGHAAWLLVAINVLYSRPYPKTLLKLARLIDGVLVFAFPFALAALAGFDLGEVLADPRRHPLLFGYLCICWTMFFVAIPVATLRRWLRRPPPHSIGHQSRVVDVAKALGHKPAGDGKYRRVAVLPGNQVFQVELTERTLQFPHLPPVWDGLTILHLTDLHFCGTPDRVYYEHVLAESLVGGTPDLVALTGDLVDSDSHYRWLLRLFGRLKWNESALAILGNHDFWHEPDRLRRRLRKCGFEVLGNGWATVMIRGEPLLAIGHEGPWFRPEPDLTGCPEGVFRLCLSHTPDNIGWARRHRIDLMLSGHNHGGQIRLPVFGPLFVPSWYSRRYDGGLYFEPPTLLHVCRGLSGKQPLRYNCRPEVTRLTLRRTPR
jgi:hypothetical protein